MLPDGQLLAAAREVEPIRERVRGVARDLARAELSERRAFARLNAAALFAGADRAGLVDAGALVERELEHALHDMIEHPAPARLWGGLAGIGWLISHLVDDATADDVCGEIDHRMIEELSGCNLAYELLRGLAGFGTYALARLHRDTGRAIAAKVLDLLERAHQPAGAGVGFWTPPERLPDEQRARSPEGRYDLGMAHGLAGVIGVLARYAIAGVEPARARALLEPCVGFLLGTAVPRAGARFPPWVTRVSGEIAPARLAWCYGDLGAALALLAAARACDRADWEAEAIAVACAAATRPFEDSGVTDTCLCHGAAGALHAFHRLYRATGVPALADAARWWLGKTLELHRQRQPSMAPPNATLLGGLSGLGLALLATTEPDEPAWDELLLFGVPTR